MPLRFKYCVSKYYFLFQVQALLTSSILLSLKRI